MQSLKSFFQKYPQLKAPTIVLALYVLIGGFIYSVTSGADEVKVSEVEQRVADDDAEKHPVKTNLIVDNGTTKIEYYARLESDQKFSALLDFHRDNSGLTYDKIEYVYGMGLEEVNGLVAPEGYVWNIYDNEKKVTFEIGNIKLENNHVYRIVLELKE